MEGSEKTCEHVCVLAAFVPRFTTRTEKEKKLLQCNSLRTTIPELCGMCPLTASDWNLHSLNNCSTQSVVVYCHSESKSSADRNTGTAGEREREALSETQRKRSLQAHRCKDCFRSPLTPTHKCAREDSTCKHSVWCYKILRTSSWVAAIVVQF